MTRLFTAVCAAALIAGCGGSDEPDSETNVVRPELPPKTTTMAEPKPDDDKPAVQSEDGPSTETTPAFKGPVVKIRIKNGLCTPDSPAAPANEKFQLQIRATDRRYDLVFDGRRRFSVPKGVTRGLVVAGRAPDEPVLTIFGEPCAVIRVGARS